MAPEFVSSFRSLGNNLLFLIQRDRSSSSSRNGLENHLERLNTILKEIRDEFEAAEGTEIRREIDKLRLKQLKDVAYKADDFLDAYHYEVLRSKMENQAETPRKRKRYEQVCQLINSFPPLILQDREESKISEGIMKICDIYDEILEDSDYLCLEEDEDYPTNWAGCCSLPPSTSSMIDGGSIFGRKTETREVVRFLLSENRRGNNVSVISIVGMAGKGKTTLAQLACIDCRLENHFNRKGWISVPPDFDATSLTKSILEAVTTVKPPSTSELRELQERLKHELWQKKVLLVLDGVCAMQRSCWESLVSPFADAEKVRIIVTTTNENVAEITESKNHPLALLPDDECRLLFEHFAFGDWDSTEKEKFTEIAAQIVSKCGGLPLAVKVLAGLLRHETRKDCWEDVLESDIWEADRENGIMAALRLSYKHLPIHLKPLFLFCSMFPKGYSFEKDELVRLWMAHNYIEPKRDERVEDIGGKYFDELRKRSFFDVVEQTSKYKMHDMIRNLALSISEGEFHSAESTNQVEISHEVRHLYVKGQGELMDSLNFNKPSDLRTLLYERLNDMVPKIPKDLRNIRCLQHGFAADYPNFQELANLIHMRYLRVCNKEITRFHESVCRLYNLQSLILDNCENLQELPCDIRNLVNLRYIGLFSLNIESLPDSMLKLKNLQKLQVVDCRRIEELPGGICNLIHLRELRLCELEIKSLPESICELTNLRLLEMCNCRSLSALPGSLGDLRKLLTMEITNSEIEELPESLCRLSELQRLNLFGNWNLKCLPSEFTGLLRLRYLELGHTGIRRLPELIDKLPLDYIRLGSGELA